MKSEYLLRINVEEHLYDSITKILRINPTSTQANWELSISENSVHCNNALDYLSILVKTNLNHLLKLGIDSSALTIWYLYEYDTQCNMEFKPEQMKTLGELGIPLCISCWQSM